MTRFLEAVAVAMRTCAPNVPGARMALAKDERPFKWPRLIRPHSAPLAGSARAPLRGKGGLGHPQR